MSTKAVTFKLPLELLEKVDEMSEGNKTALIIGLLNQAISMRKVEEPIREIMYTAAKNATRETKLLDDHKDVRNLIDGLWI